MHCCSSFLDYLRPDISKGITTWKSNRMTSKNFFNYLRPDISKGITTLHYSDLVSSHMFLDYLRPDISKGITTYLPVSPWYCSWYHYLRPDISKGITTWERAACYIETRTILSTTWHIKRDYDCPVPARLNTKYPSYYLRPDISKGITTTHRVYRIEAGLLLLLSTTWHIKRDYDSSTTIMGSVRWKIIYDLTYQKGLRLLTLPKWWWR